MNNKSNIIIALLGVAIEVFLTLVGLKIADRNKKFDGDYNRWRKLNLILQEVQKIKNQNNQKILLFLMTLKILRKMNLLNLILIQFLLPKFQIL